MVAVHDDFESVVAGRFHMDGGYDNDEEPWQRLGRAVLLRWLTRRMIVRSGNLATGHGASSSSYAEMLDLLSRQEYRDEIPAALPADVPIANKGGWIEGVQHDAALIRPAGAPAYILTVRTTGLGEADGRELIRTVSAAAWADRRSLRSAA